MKAGDFFSRWVQGMRDLTPKQILEAKVAGLVGTTIGLSLASGTLFYRVTNKYDTLQLGFAIFVFFLAYLQFIELKKSLIEIDNYKKTMEMMKNV